MVEVKDGTQLRVVTAAAENVPQGAPFGCICRRNNAGR
jgi:hypothetical protein